MIPSAVPPSTWKIYVGAKSGGQDVPFPENIKGQLTVNGSVVPFTAKQGDKPIQVTAQVNPLATCGPLPVTLKYSPQAPTAPFKPPVSTNGKEQTITLQPRAVRFVGYPKDCTGGTSGSGLLGIELSGTNEKLIKCGDSFNASLKNTISPVTLPSGATSSTLKLAVTGTTLGILDVPNGSTAVNIGTVACGAPQSFGITVATQNIDLGTDKNALSSSSSSCMSPRIVLRPEKVQY
ncbi:MAG: hypothetical protein KIT84_42360 [Labilithrix sp.]|nr:hypothetical protein [Labilithrix sp.]MCW5817720.1 hypothetical protein [Labilithrix sp.]